MICIIDYGMGNLRSVQKAFEHVGAQAVITEDANQIRASQKIVLPGVGAMQPAMDKLRALNLVETIKEEVNGGKPFLGICLGFQLLFESSDEGGGSTGLGLIAGKVPRFKSLKVPHMGWNQLNIINNACPLFNSIENGTNVYFCHSYYAAPEDAAVSATTTDYGISFTSSVYNNNIFGVQFHPEKSQGAGLTMLQNFAEIHS